MNSGSSGAKDYSSAKNIVSSVYPIMEKALPRTAQNWAKKQFFTPLKFKFRKKEQEFLSTSRASFFSFKDKKIALYEWGEGPIILLQHGWAGKGVQFIEIIKVLSGNGFRVIAIDGPSHGNSTGKWTSAYEFIDVIKELIKHYDNIHTCIGHSLGGLVLMNVMSLDIKFNNMILINVPTKSDSVMNAFLGIIGGSAKTGQFIRDYIEKKYNKSLDSLFTPQIKPDLTKNTLVIHDKKDRQVSFDNIGITKELLPQAKFHFTEGLGHTRILYDKDVASKMLEYVLSR